LLLLSIDEVETEPVADPGSQTGFSQIPEVWLHHVHGQALQSLMESAKVPACSRIGCICPEFSAYLNAV